MRLYTKKYLGDIYIILSIILLFTIGLFIIYSATDSKEHYSPFFIKQFFGFIFGIFIVLIISVIPYKKIITWGNIFHIIVLILLIITLLKGSSVMGARRWINLGLFKIQPSELAKISLPIAIINYKLNNIIGKTNIYDWIKLLLLIMVTSLIIIKQPDLGSGIIVGGSGFIMLYILGLPKKIITNLLIIFFLLTPIIWNIMHDYQKKRILVFLGNGSIKKERYQLEQSRIAIGSGGFIGKGFLNGTQKNFKFLPENRTDFIFSVLAEEFGFLGITFVILIYFFLIFRLFRQTLFIDEEDPYLLSCGLIIPIAISIIFNIGMVIGLLPIVGIPLPCMSYGISHSLSTFFIIGIINNILKEC